MAPNNILLGACILASTISFVKITTETPRGCTREDPSVMLLAASESMYLRGAPSSSEKGGAWSALKSGWDEVGFNLYSEEKDRLTEVVVKETHGVVTHRVLPLEEVNSVNEVLLPRGTGIVVQDAEGKDISFMEQLGDGNGPPRWEPKTMTNFFRHLSSCRYYIGFGTWIGPTMFYAAQLVDEAYGMEADPVAFAKVETNLALNRKAAWASKVHLSPHAIGIGSSETDSTAATVKMSSAMAGDSCSGIAGKLGCGEANVNWEVNAHPLPYLMKRWNVPSSGQTFVKVDVESYECQLVPSWIEWLGSIQGAKPTFHIAFHSNFNECTPEEYGLVYQFANMFEYKEENCMDKEKKVWICGLGEFLFHDRI